MMSKVALDAVEDGFGSTGAPVKKAKRAETWMVLRKKPLKMVSQSWALSMAR